MNRLIKLCIAWSMPAMTIPVFAGEPPKSVRSIAPVQYESVKGDPLNARIYTLPNGLKVYLSVYKNAPRIQTYIAVKAGSKNDPSNATGLAHYLEHMVFKGTDKYGTKDFAKESAELKKVEDLFETYRETRDVNARKSIYRRIDSISGIAAKYAIANEYDKMLATIGAEGTNAFTSFDQTVYVNDIPSNQVGNWLKIESERFRKPVLRLFHTELEAVYEEKNRGLDDDDNKVWEAMFEALFRKHTYGTQTTIGTIEHLKNPSMKEINRYYEKHYVPNNMAIIMSGDFDPDMVILDITKHFGGYAKKAVPTFTYETEPQVAGKTTREVMGPNPANVALGWRFGGDGTRDADLGTLVAALLYNGTAGLMDINLNQAQKVLKSNCYFYALKDYGFFGMSGEPKEGQKLEDVESLLSSQLELLKTGDFPDWLLPAVVTDLRLKRTKELQDNSTRADIMLTAFVDDVPWQKAVGQLDRISAFTKKDIMEFATRHFDGNNYAVVYKRIGEDKSVAKVEKPAITPVELDRTNTSPFVSAIEKSVPKPIEPRFLDYDKDISRANLGSGIPVLYNKNNENRLFELYYRFDMGSNNNRLLPVVVKYIPYLSTEGMTAAQVKEELYKIGCAFNVFSDQENTWVSLTGLDDSFGKGVQLFEKLLSNPVVDQTVLKNLVADIQKERSDNKLQKRLILHRAMTNYARYGPQNPYTNVLTNEELEKVTTDEIRSFISQLTGYAHKVLYYGPRPLEQLTAELSAAHKVTTPLKPVPPAKKFEEQNLQSNVFVVDYDMTQAEIVMLSNGGAFDAQNVPIIELYNAYFGGSMSSVLFQELREARALAYSTWSRYNQPNRLHKKYYNFSYIGSQADKLGEALAGLSEMLNNMPKSESSFQAARESVIQEMRTQRITRADVLFNYLQAQDLGLNTDIRKTVFDKVQSYRYSDVMDFQSRQIKGRPLTVLVLGKKDMLDNKTLEKYGSVKFLELKDVFGY
jgi:predicted Zn-dependent peptidase